MKTIQQHCVEISSGDMPESSYKSIFTAILVVACLVITALVLGVVSMGFFSVEQMYIVSPIIASCCVFIVFSYILWFRIRANIFGEICFIYLGLALAYTILPAFTVINTDFIVPLGFDGPKFVTLYPKPSELGIHFWRHVLYIFGVAFGYIIIRGTKSPFNASIKPSNKDHLYIIVIITAMLISNIVTIMLLSSPVTNYHEHYTRFEHLSWPMLKLVQFSLIFKTGGYFVLMSLMFNQYSKYKLLIFALVPLLCIYEITYSFGSRIETLTILVAFAGFYHYKVKPLTLKKGLTYLIALAMLFSVVELVRSARMNEQSVESIVAVEGIKSATEFSAVFTSGFHLYSERAEGNIPPRDWQMFFYEFIALIPFLDHTEFHPQYWYARNYFPNAVVPPQTMGVISDSAIWGGELDLLLRSILNGAIYAALTRWFIRRSNKWWAITIYIYCYATCIMTLKYSIFYQLPLLIKILLPVIVFTAITYKILTTITNQKTFQLEYR